MLVHVLTLLYGVSGFALVACYIPQALSAWRDQNGAQAVSIVTWSFWLVCATVALAYAALVVKDLAFAATNVGNVAGCATVLSVALIKRREARHARLRPPPALENPELEQFA